MKQNIIKNLKKSAMILGSLVLFAFLTTTPVSAAANIDGGNFMTATNNTAGNGTWSDPVDAKPGEVIEFRIQAWNNGDATAEHVQIIGGLPSNPVTTLQATGTIQSPSISSLHDTATVNVTGGTQQGFAYIPGHVRLFGVTNLFNCPNGCVLPDTVASSGIEVGDIPAGGSVQIMFKAYVTNAVEPTTAPTAPPTTAPTTPPSGGSNANANANASANASACVGDHACSSSATGGSVTIVQPAVAAPQVVASAPSTAKSLPKTGLPVAGAAMVSLLPIGLKLRKKFAGTDTDNANFIWEERLFKKD